MNTNELLVDLGRKFPRALDILKAWAPDYRRIAEGHEGEELARAYRIALDGWTETTCPKPAHIAEHLPKPASQAPGQVRQSWDEKDRERAVRAKDLEKTARLELAAWWPIAEAEGWAGYLTLHLARMAMEVARLEQGSLVTIDRALTHINGRERRPGYPPRGLIAWADDADAEIFRARAASQERVRKRRASVDSGAVARQDRMRNRILDAAESRPA